jgi:hypothetical protein
MLATAAKFQTSYDDDITAQLAEDIFVEEISVIHKSAMDEWIHIIAQLWQAVGKDINNLDPKDINTINLYGKQLRDVPLGLLEIGVNYAIKNNTYKTVPAVGLIYEGIRAELEKLQMPPATDMDTKIERWINLRFTVYRFGDNK